MTEGNQGWSGWGNDFVIHSYRNSSPELLKGQYLRIITTKIIMIRIRIRI